MKKKKMLALLLAVTTLITAVTGCGGSPDAGESSPAGDGESSVSADAGDSSAPAESDSQAGDTGGSKDPITLTWQYNATVDVAPYVDAFTKSYEEKTGIPVKIELTATGEDWLDTKKTAVAAGVGPDVWNMDVNWMSSWKDTVIQPVSNYLDAEVFEGYVPQGVDLWKSGDDYYALPVTFSVVAFVYNKDLADEIGLDMSKEWTFEDFEAYLATAEAYLKDKTVEYTDGESYPYYLLGANHTMYYWWLLVGVYGGTPLCDTNNIAQEAFVNGILKMAEWRSKGYSAQQITPGGTQAAFSDACNVLFWPTGDWTITGLTRLPLGIESDPLPLNVNYASIAAPLGQDGKSHTEVYNQGMVMNKNLEGEKAKAAAEFIKYMTVDVWREVYGPDTYNYCLPGKTDLLAEYPTWLPEEQHGIGFLDTLEKGVIHSPDYQAGGIDLTSSVHNVVEAAYAEVEANGFDEAALRTMITGKLEAEQELINVQLEENEIELDNPDAKVK